MGTSARVMLISFPSVGKISVLLLSAMLTLSAVPTAFAHAALVVAAPPAGGDVTTAPSEVQVTFNEKLETTFSTIIVRNSVGKRVDKGDARVEGADRKAMRVSVQPLTQGIYIVEWRALTTDTHRTEGAFIFRVAE